MNPKLKSALVIFVEIAVLAGILFILSLFFTSDPRGYKLSFLENTPVLNSPFGK